MSRRSPEDGERGSIPLELAILAPALLLIISVVVFGGRLALAHQAVEAAAASAAREASIARTASAASSSARATAADALAQEGLRCSSTTVSIDTSAFNSPVGTPGSVSATITCVVPLGDLVLPGFPGSRTVTATVSSPLDTYRER